MAGFKQQGPYNTPIKLLIPTYGDRVKGVSVPRYPDVDKGELLFCSFKTFGGTETTINGVYTVLDTASVETWYDPNIKSDCRIALAETGAIYEIIGEPENINMRNQYMKFKVKRVKGGA